jgi:hypothetical protein
VTAIAPGEDYNIDETTYTSPTFEGAYVITGSEMKGGSSKVVNVVTQSDIDGAKNELLTNQQVEAKRELAGQFESDDFVIEASFSENVQEVTSDPPIDQEVNGSATITVKVTYSELGVKTEQLTSLFKAKESAKINPQTQGSLGVVDEGLDAAKISLKDKPAPTTQRFTAEAEALLGPDIDFRALAEQLGGKRYSEAIEIVKGYPGVSGADVKFSPFWVRRVPTNPDKVKVEIKIPEQ